MSHVRKYKPRKLELRKSKPTRLRFTTYDFFLTAREIFQEVERDSHIFEPFLFWKIHPPYVYAN